MLRFTIRDVLWLTVVVAMGLGWARQRSLWNSETDALRLSHERDLAEAKRMIESRQASLYRALGEERDYLRRRLDNRAD